MINSIHSTNSTNIAHICGEVIDPIQLNHTTYGESFYTFRLGICRSSGYEDQIVVMASERILEVVAVEPGKFLDIHGQIRTYNEEADGRNRLNVVIFVRDMEEAETEHYVNDIYLEGYLCKKPLARTSPMGRKICDIMLAVNRMYNKSDYIPCIAWGRNAVYSGTLEVGDKICINGRIQSRQYKKKLGDGQVLEKTAYEVSILQMEQLIEPEKE